MSNIDGGKTGWPPGLLQDDCKGLSRWLASRVDARWAARKAITGEAMTDLDEFHRHEALDRANMLSSMVSQWLLDHPYVQSRPKIAAKIEQACQLLYSAYQGIGTDIDSGGKDE